MDLEIKLENTYFISYHHPVPNLFVWFGDFIVLNLLVSL